MITVSNVPSQGGDDYRQQEWATKEALGHRAVHEVRVVEESGELRVTVAVNQYQLLCHQLPTRPKGCGE